MTLLCHLKNNRQKNSRTLEKIWFKVGGITFLSIRSWVLFTMVEMECSIVVAKLRPTIYERNLDVWGEVFNKGLSKRSWSLVIRILEKIMKNFAGQGPRAWSGLKYDTSKTSFMNRTSHSVVLNIEWNLKSSLCCIDEIILLFILLNYFTWIDCCNF